MQAQEVQALPLRDIKLPAEPGFWPLAPGWWLVMIIMTALFIWLGIKWYKHTKKKRRWLEIDQQLSQIEFDFKQSNNKQKFLTDVSTFLRRFVKFQVGDHLASSLTGHEWIKYLSQFNHSESISNFETALTVGVFQPDYPYDAERLLSVIRHFIKHQVMKPVSNQRSGYV